MHLIRRERGAAYCVLVLTAVFAFLAGYGFQKFLNSNKVSERDLLHRRSIYNDKKILEKRNFESRDRLPGDEEYDYDKYHESVLGKINQTFMIDTLRYLSAEPHMGGTQRNMELADFVATSWKKFGIETVKFNDYDAYLSIPKEPGLIQIFDENNTLIYEKIIEEKPLSENENMQSSVYPFNAFSASGDVTGRYVNVNYGEIKDYADLEKLKKNVSLEGKIHIARYGFGFRGEKARLAEKFGGIGLLLYPEPKDVNDMGTKGFPDSWEMPPSGIPRGNLLNTKGDPLTPLYAAKECYQRRDPEKVSYFAKIPVQPISYEMAEYILGTMKGMDPQDQHWQGGMNFNYTVEPCDNRTMRLKVNTPKEIRKIRNVVGTIQGCIEPDRIVMIGNHRDAWVYGALDASSGTAVLMQVAKLLGEAKENGWCPRRTIMLVSWDAEEYGLMGSVEWGQEFRNLLSQRVVAYINIDIGVSGNYTFRAKASPGLINGLYDVTKTIRDPDVPDKRKLYESWLRKSGAEPDDKPRYTQLAAGSDFTYFASNIGISCIDVRYMYDQDSHPYLSNYPTYHTIHDNFEYMMKFIDPDFRYHAVVAEVVLSYAFRMADSIILPISVQAYADKILEDIIEFQNSLESEVLQVQNISFDPISEAAFDLQNEAKRFEKIVKEGVNKENPLEVRRLNDVLMQFERSFIIPEGIIGTPDSKHVIYGPIRKTLFHHKFFPGLSDTLYYMIVEGRNLTEEVKEQIWLIVSHIKQARDLITDTKALWDKKDKKPKCSTEL